MSNVRILARHFLHHHKTPNPSSKAPSTTSYGRTYSASVSASCTTAPPPPQNEYLIVIPDHPNTSAARVKAQPGHVKAATPLIDAGIITYFGVTLSDAAAGKEQSDSISGSAIVMKAQSEEEVREFLEKDEYTKFGVWNVKDARIWGFRSG